MSQRSPPHSSAALARAGREATEPAQQVHPAHELRHQRHAVLPVPRLEQLRCSATRGSRRGTLARAGLAGETGIKRCRPALALRNSWRPPPHCPSSAARIVLARPRVDMISSPVAMNVGHMVGACLVHPAAAVALFEIANERAVLGGKRQHRFEGQLQFVPRAPTKVRVIFVLLDPRPADVLLQRPNDLSGIEEVAWIERSLDRAHHAQQFVAELLAR